MASPRAFSRSFAHSVALLAAALVWGACSDDSPGPGVDQDTTEDVADTSADTSDTDTEPADTGGEDTAVDAPSDTDVLDDVAVDTPEDGTDADVTDEGADVEVDIDAGDVDAESDGVVRSARVTFPVPLGEQYADVPLTGGTTTTFPFSFDLAAIAGTFQILEGGIDLVATVGRLTFVPSTTETDEAPVLLVSVRTGPPSEVDTVCDTGEAYGPAEVALDPSTLVPTGAVDPEHVDVTETTIATLNAGGMVGCIQVTAPVDGTLTLTDLVIDFRLGEICEAAPADIAGVWVGTMTCGSLAFPPTRPETTELTMTIVQPGRRASYTDGEGEYNGYVCGNTFSFAGGADTAEGMPEGYIESGRFVVNEDGETATKTSTYHDAFDNWGDCSVELTRE